MHPPFGIPEIHVEQKYHLLDKRLNMCERDATIIYNGLLCITELNIFIST